MQRENGNPVVRQTIVEGEEARIGAHASNDLVLADPLVSRFHCRVVRADTGWTLVDSGSLNGTFVDGLRVRDADLPPRDCELQLGDSSVRIRELASKALVQIPDTSSFGDLCGASPAMRKVFALLEKVAATDATVLIEGESGTGKELAASEIVRRGRRAQAPFVVIDCSAISPTLMESELFGHARGSFTGAERARVGAFEAAHGGTVFLDEIGEMPSEMQSKLLRVLEAGEVRRVGENDVRRIDVRVIAATNRRLEQEVNRGRFREDLYFRLSVVTIRMPPLRSHLDDLELLVEVLLRAMGAEEQAHLFHADALREMRGHDWPGNVRELRNHIERALVLGTASAPHGREASPASPEDPSLSSSKVDLKVPLRLAKERIVADFERRYLVELLEAHGDNVSRAARQAGIDRMHMYRLLQRHGLRERALKA